MLNPSSTSKQTFPNESISTEDETSHSISVESENDGITILHDIINNKSNQLHVYKNITYKLSVKQENQ